MLTKKLRSSLNLAPAVCQAIPSGIRALLVRKRHGLFHPSGGNGTAFLSYHGVGPCQNFDNFASIAVKAHLTVNKGFLSHWRDYRKNISLEAVIWINPAQRAIISGGKSFGIHTCRSVSPSVTV